jgi:glycosyltransferase involved in cell wall biosynthesis
LAEGLGMVAVEAQAAGLPVLASDTTPREGVVVSELVNSFPLAESAESWAKEVLRILDQPTRPARFCNQAVRDSGFSIENSAARLLDIYGASSLT